MAVRLRKWTTASGEDRSAWVVDYLDGRGKRRLKTFPAGKGQESKARDFEAKTRMDIRKGVHVADSASLTVAEAGEKWLSRLEAIGRSRKTLSQYRGHFENHIKPFLGRFKLSQIDALLLSDFEDHLLSKANGAKGRGGKLHPQTVSFIVGTFGLLLSDAQDRGLIGHNIVRDRKRRITTGPKRRLEVGRDIPTSDEVRSLIAAAKPGFNRAMLVTAIFTGLRVSELRGLRWEDVDFQKALLHVRQKMDHWNDPGLPKTAAGSRTIPLPPIVLNTLREWRLQSPGELCFHTRTGKALTYSHVVSMVWEPTLKAAGLAGKYSGLHCLRHFYASWCINSKEDGGLGLSPKAAQERLGHTSVTMTLDVYGHLFPSGDDGSALAEAERRLLG